MGAYSKNHLVTAAYLKNWCADDDKLRVRRVRTQTSARASPRSVGFERAWWSNDPALNASAEQACSKLEQLVPDLIGDARRAWPYEGQRRAELAELIALHVVRTRAWRRWHEDARETSLAQRIPQFSTKHPHLVDEFTGWARSDSETVTRMEEIVGSIVGVLASMHWTLLQFDEPTLVTSDQPVAAMPLPPAEGRAAFAAMPTGGWLETLEVRFPISPSHGLLMSWAHGPERTIDASWEQALDFNMPTIEQAEYEVYSYPEQLAAIPGPPRRWASSLAFQCFPEYTASFARDSDHRQRVFEALAERINTDPDERGPTPIIRPTASVHAA